MLKLDRLVMVRGRRKLIVPYIDIAKHMVKCYLLHDHKHDHHDLQSEDYCTQNYKDTITFLIKQKRENLFFSPKRQSEYQKVKFE